MMNCQDVEGRITPLVDGELVAAEAEAVNAHLAACPACRRAAEQEQTCRRVLRECAPRLAAHAPVSLKARVRGALPAAPRSRSRAWRWALAAAAMLTIFVGLLAVAGVVQPVPVFAAQAALDHLKCLRLGPHSASSDARAIEASWKAWQGWDLKVPTGQTAGLRLLGYRRCVVTEGKLAHLIYERNGSIVSLFVLPGGPDVARAELEMFGQDAVLWSSHGRTYALVGRGSRGALTAAAASLELELKSLAPSGPGL
jgi:anti-sigma factor (TIGR02949 family)